MQVVLQKNHIHCGKTFTAGEILDADEQTANWLIMHNIATAYTSVAATTQQADAELSASSKRVKKQSETLQELE